MWSGPSASPPRSLSLSSLSPSPSFQVYPSQYPEPIESCKSLGIGRKLDARVVTAQCGTFSNSEPRAALILIWSHLLARTGVCSAVGLCSHAALAMIRAHSYTAFMLISQRKRLEQSSRRRTRGSTQSMTGGEQRSERRVHKTRCRHSTPTNPVPVCLPAVISHHLCVCASSALAPRFRFY